MESSAAFATRLEAAPRKGDPMVDQRGGFLRAMKLTAAVAALSAMTACAPAKVEPPR
jgi:hypothetical protein